MLGTFTQEMKGVGAVLDELSRINQELLLGQKKSKHHLMACAPHLN